MGKKNFSRRIDLSKQAPIPSKIFFMFLIAILSLNLTNCQTISPVTSVSLQYDGIFGVGWGVFAIILGIIVGVFCCVFSRSTVQPGIYVSIGFCIPTVLFIFLAFAPLTQPGNTNLKDNTATNGFIIVRWLFFSVMLCALLLLLIPLLGIWNSMLIPQRVDSRAQKEYFEKYEKTIRKNDKTINNQSDKKNDAIPAQNFNPINPMQENETRIQINDRKYAIINNNQLQENLAMTSLDLNNKKKNFLGGLTRRRKNEES